MVAGDDVVVCASSGGRHVAFSVAILQTTGSITMSLLPYAAVPSQIALFRTKCPIHRAQ